MGSDSIIILSPVFYHLPGVLQTWKPVSVTAFVANRPLKLSTKAFSIGFPGLMKLSFTPLSVTYVKKRHGYVLNPSETASTKANGNVKCCEISLKTNDNDNVPRLIKLMWPGIAVYYFVTLPKAEIHYYYHLLIVSPI